jgi:hypothetical protein
VESRCSLELDGALLAQAVAATFKRRGTEVPSGVPVGLSTAFAADADKNTQWAAFVRRIRIEPAPPFAAVVARIQRFAMPVFASAVGTTPLRTHWSPSNEWS